MRVRVINPLDDPRWGALLHHQRASIFHTREWLSALQESYGYNPIGFTTSPADEPLQNALVFCAVRSWITGRRLVSLPFSDHCDPLVSSPGEYKAIMTHVRDYVAKEGFNYAEVRPVVTAPFPPPSPPDLEPLEPFFLHTLSLGPPLEALFCGLHTNSFQRKIRRAEKETLICEEGRSDTLLHKFYHLLIKTRLRHGIPPQPLHWFRHLITSMGNRLTIRVASKDDRPVAAILTLAFRDTVTYKYGCSDENFNHLGGMPFLLWRTIQGAKETGMRQLDLGRSDIDNLGLVRFKDRLGANRLGLQYYRFASGAGPKRCYSPRNARVLNGLMYYMPNTLLVAAGRLFYRHIG
jgi:hypothetical protein